MSVLSDSPAESGSSRVRRVRHKLKRRRLCVQRVEQPSPLVRRVHFTGEDLADFVSLSFDDHLKLFLPVADGEAPLMRDYTPRHFHAAARELSIEFALHGDGPAAHWAAQARPGQVIEVGGPRGSFILPDDLDWQLLIGDASALPALARRLEELPAGAPVQAIVLMPDLAERRPLDSQAALQLQWVADDAACLAAARAWQRPAGDGMAWCAGEAGLMAALRRVLVEEQGLPRHSVRASAYWKRGTAAHHERLEG